jgi:DoxX-like family
MPDGGEQLMTNDLSNSNISRHLWAGRIVTGLVVLFMLFDCSIKLMKLPAAVVGTVQLGYPESLVRVIGTILLVCTIFYVIPQTEVFGGILLTGYLGGAIASTMRAGKPLGYDLFPLIFGVLAWTGLYLRDAKLRQLIPLRSSQKT